MSFETGTDAYALARRPLRRPRSPRRSATRRASAPGDTALDVGCGPGALAAELARRLGAGARRRRRAVGSRSSRPRRAAVPGADLRAGRAEELPFEDGAFDVVLSQLVVNFMEDPPRGVAEMRASRAERSPRASGTTRTG